MWQDFKAFLLKQNALALAIAVVIGTALNKVVTAIVDDFIMPLVGALSPGGEWQTKLAYDLGPVKHIAVGDFLSALLNFFIVGIVAWRLSKLVPTPPAGPAAKSCPRCFASIDARATRCPQCTSELGAAA